ncbi:MAG TPA: response regulator [Solirubrobacteraceae bacterium]|nr:response regulator [Solirubrobacteraceae bacterium]
MALSVLIVDDEHDFHTMAGRLLTLRGFDVAGHAGDGAAAVRLARTLQPNAVLLDVNLPDATGFEVARRLAQLPVPPRVLLTSADQEVTVGLIDECGAAAFVPKDELPSSDLAELFGGEQGL